jgi:HSP20 family protein
MHEQTASTRAPVLLFRADDDAWRIPSDSAGPWKARDGSHVWRPPTDVFEIEDAFIVVVEVAGMRGAEFSVSLENRVLWVRGSRRDTRASRAYHQMEVAYGDFETAVGLPAAVDAARIEATYSDGFLRVTLPKSKPRSIKIAG